ncbi:1-phosphofructokinase family hexose kinase [Treponema bryantii]|uniref:1-phosphofructokinase family hexose kinase n=1 Tax=Treponema bryantii TaxID=163 RepID=UPI0003B60D87|nr:PfkB family carbohydrate kinase [Treponema bryantii]
MKILCICLSSTLQRTITFDSLKLERVNRSKYYRLDASGKAVNSARVLEQLEPGCSTVVCPLGEKNLSAFTGAAERDKLNILYATIPGQTRECWTLLDRTAGTTTELVVGEPLLEGADELKAVAAAEIKILKIINDMLPQVDAVLLAGSRPKIWSDDLYATISGMTRDAGKIFLADYIGQDMTKTLAASVPDIIKINEEEFRATFPELADQPLQKAITEKSRQLDNIIIVTRGTESTYAADRGQFSECPSEKVTALNTTACGDSFNAGFIYEYLKNRDQSGTAAEKLAAALQKGTWCAARNAELEAPGAIR